mmetsp:Transcript_28626/g.27610  ORF Transcript_28626/g.27610 Transcript_28626/m.27610 type:complete len:121 (-) Transcript_28626:1531-1893(-)
MQSYRSKQQEEFTLCLDDDESIINNNPVTYESKANIKSESEGHEFMRIEDREAEISQVVPPLKLQKVVEKRNERSFQKQAATSEARPAKNMLEENKNKVNERKGSRKTIQELVLETPSSR